MRLLLAILGLCLVTNLSAQQGNNKGERIESMKIAFITKELNLSPAESEVFWPEYNVYQKELKDLRQSKERERINLSEISEDEAAKLIEERLGFEEQKLAMKRSFVQRLDGKLSKKKTAKLLKLEEKFKKEILGKVRKKMEQKEQAKGMRRGQ